jgi:hypothetical protein
MSDDVQQFIAETENAEDLGALPWWMPTKRTPAIVGRVLEYRAIDTEYGRMRGAAVELIGQAVVQDGQRDGPRLADKGERAVHDEPFHPRPDLPVDLERLGPALRGSLHRPKLRAQ